MSVEREIELVGDAEVNRYGDTEVKVKFTYDNGSSAVIRLNLGRISSEDEFWRMLEDSWWHNRPDGKPDSQYIVDGGLKAGKKKKVK